MGDMLGGPVEPESAYAVADPANAGGYAPIGGDDEEFDDPGNSGHYASPQKFQTGEVVYAGSSEEEFDDPAAGANRQIYSMPSKDLSAVEQAAFDKEMERLQGGDEGETDEGNMDV